MRIHILGICGTFMGGIALLARASGHQVSGQDANVYPPMSSQLAEQGIAVTEGYAAEDIPADIEMVVIGNALSRGNPAVEHVLNGGLPYTSGPQWLAEHILKDRWVLAVAGTHGKTTTSAMLAWILEQAGLAPGFLIGGVPLNFGLSARSGGSPFFVVEADEYDTAFFDKRSKFVHYRPRTLILNNLEYDHADIFPDLAAIQRQFHHLVRTVPGQGLILSPADEPHLAEVLSMGCWTPIQHTALESGQGWVARQVAPDGSRFDVYRDEVRQGAVQWSLLGMHNVRNALTAIAAAHHAGIPVLHALEALSSFQSVKRRLELKGVVAGITVYDDFAHHPTAIAATLAGLRKRVGRERILVALEPRSNTMRLGVHKETLGASLSEADEVFFFQPGDIEWALCDALVAGSGELFGDVAALVAAVVKRSRPGDHVVVMSNGGFGGIHDRLLRALEEKEA